MSAVTIIRQRKCVHVLSDGAGIGPDGKLSILLSKVYALPHVGVVLGLRGLNAVSAGVSHFLNSGTATNYDDWKDGLPDRLRQFWWHGLTPFDRIAYPGSRFDLFVAGWSERNGPESFCIFSYDHPSGLLKAWQITELGPIAPFPSTDAMFTDLGLIDAEAFDPDRDGVRIVTAQRAIAEPFNAAGDMGCIVGAFIQLTTLDGDGISQKILQRWPEDRVGSPIAVIS